MPEEFVEDILDETKTLEVIEKSSEEIVDTKTETKETDLIKETTKTDDVDETKETIKTDEKEVTIEDLAAQIGWNANYAGENPVDAATYILKSREIQDTMKENNKDLKTQLSSVQGSIDALKDHNERVYKTDVKRMQSEIETLKKQKRDAVELADVKKVDEIDQQIDDLQKDIDEPKPEEKESTNPVFDTWLKDNQWYLTDQDMAVYAENIAKQYQGAPLDRIYKIVRQKVAEVFPEKFDVKKTEEDLKNVKEKAIGPKSPVEAVKKTNENLNFTKADLTPEQITIMSQFVRTGVMTEEQYIKDIAKMQEG